MVEHRRYQRAPIDIAVEFSAKGTTDLRQGRATDASLGGMFIATKNPLDYKTALVIHFTPPDGGKALLLQGVVRWTNAEGMGVQFGLLGARETHALTELSKG